MSNRLDAIKDVIDMQNENGYLVNKLNKVAMKWLIEQAELAEEQAKLIEDMESAIDSLNGR